MATLNIEITYDADLRADKLDADELARRTSEALVTSLDSPMRDLNPTVTVDGGKGRYPVEA